jgi:hypothetical protein
LIFFENASAHLFRLSLPTSLQGEQTSNLDDYGKEENARVPERRAPFRPTGAPVVMQFYCHEVMLAISTAIIPTTKSDFSATVEGVR